MVTEVTHMCNGCGVFFPRCLLAVVLCRVVSSVKLSNRQICRRNILLKCKAEKPQHDTREAHVCASRLKIRFEPNSSILVLKMSDKRTPQPVTRYEEDQVHNKTWSESDKRVLLSGLKKHGHTDIKSLAKILPNKSPAAIKTMIANLMTAARRSTKQNKIPPIDMWLEQASVDETNSLIPQALLFISTFERHPRPEQCGGCDLRAAYDYIYRMTQGHSMVAIPPKTRRIVYKVISKTVSKMRLKSPENLFLLINNLYKSTSRRDYTRRPQRPQKIGPYTLLDELNTFMVPSDQLRIT